MDPQWLSPSTELDELKGLLLTNNALVTDISQWRLLYQGLPKWVWGTQSTKDVLEDCVLADLRILNRLPARPGEPAPPLATLLTVVVGRLENRPEKRRAEGWLKAVQERKEAPDAPREFPADLPLIDITALPDPADRELFEGREEPLDKLDEFWADPGTVVVPVVALGGVGKSALVWHWVRRLPREVAACPQMFAWSFYSQGQHDYEKDSAKFFDRARRHFRRCLDRCPAPVGGAIDLTSDAQPRLAEELARAFAHVGGLLILDGVEPLQHPEDVLEGSIKDDDLRAFLRQLRGDLDVAPDRPRRLLLLTTRWSIGDLPSDPAHGVRQLNLKNLTPEQGTQLLQKARIARRPGLGIFYGRGISPDHPAVMEAFKRTVEQHGGHALSLVLLASYILTCYDGDLSRKTDLDEFALEESGTIHRYARRMIRCYDQRLFADPDRSTPRLQTCRKVLLLLGLFDRPAPRADLDLLRRSGSREFFGQLGEREFLRAIEELGALRFVTNQVAEPTAEEPFDEGAADDPGPPVAHDETIGTHPLIREYFGQRFREESPAAWRAAHGLLYEVLRDKVREADELPRTVDGLAPVFEAVVHGCRAGRFQEVFQDVYVPLILNNRPNEVPNLPGGFGPLLSAISHFFEPGKWDRPVAASAVEPGGLTNTDQLQVLIQAGLYLLPTKGYSAAETRACYFKGRELIDDGIGSPAQRFSILFGVWRCAMSSGDQREAKRVADRIERLAAESKAAAGADADPAAGSALERAASLAMTVTHTFRGEFGPALAFARRGTASVKAVGAQAAGQFLSEPGVTCMVFEAMDLWYLGRHDEARQVGDRAVELALNLTMGGYHHNRVVVLYFEAFVHQYRSEPPEAAARAGQLIDLCHGQGYSFWQSGAVAMQGWARATHGAVRTGVTALTPWPRRQEWAARDRDEVKAGLAQLREGRLGWARSGAGVNLAYWMTLEAELYLALGDNKEAARLLRQAIARAEDTADWWWLAESHRLLGVSKWHTDRDGESYEAEFAQAQRTASRQKAKSLELRALVSLHDVRVGQGRGAETRPLLAGLLKDFPATDNSHDLREARWRAEEAAS